MKRKPDVKGSLIKCLSRYDGPFAVLLSGGAHSHPDSLGAFFSISKHLNLTGIDAVDGSPRFALYLRS